MTSRSFVTMLSVRGRFGPRATPSPRMMTCLPVGGAVRGENSSSRCVPYCIATVACAGCTLRCFTAHEASVSIALVRSFPRNCVAPWTPSCRCSNRALTRVPLRSLLLIVKHACWGALTSGSPFCFVSFAARGDAGVCQRVSAVACCV